VGQPRAGGGLCLGGESVLIFFLPVGLGGDVSFFGAMMF
jgi:hypothetical protein